MLEVYQNDKFRMKGTVVKRLKEYVTLQQGPDVFNELTHKINWDLPDFVMASTWYPARPFFKLIEAAATQSGVSLDVFCHDFSENTIKSDLNTVYRFIVRTAGARAVLGKLPRLAAAYANFTHFDVLANNDGYFRAWVGSPSIFNEITLLQLQGGMRGILRVCNKELNECNVISEDKYSFEEEPYIRATYELRYS